MKSKLFTLVMLAVLFIPHAAAFASEGAASDVLVDVAQANADKFGFITLLPPLISIVLAFITKNVVTSLFVGVLSGSIILQFSGFNILGTLVGAFSDFVERMLEVLSNSWNAGIMLQCLTIGGVIALVAKMGGARAIAEYLAKRAKSPRSAQLVTWIIGLLIFFDDYANSLIVGPIMRPVTDKLKISREKLAFIVDATAAPIAGMAIISTWIGYELSLIRDAFQNGIGVEVDAMGFFLSSLPYRFYNIFILGFIFFTIIFLKEFGPMYKAESRARLTGKVLGDKAQPMVESEITELEPKPGIKLSIWNAIIPIGTLIVGALVGFYHDGFKAIMAGNDDALIELFSNSPFSFVAIQQAFSNSDASVVLFQSALLATIVALIMGVGKKIFKLSEGIETWVNGSKSLMITAVILMLAWSLSSVIKELGTSKYLVSVLNDVIPAFLLPTIVFVLGGVISFSTGTSYGTMGILMPLAIPLAYTISGADMNYVIVSGSAVLTGAILGDHCSPISDTTILSSMGTACDHIDHTKTQLWYALFVGGCAILFGYLPAGLGVPVYILLPIGLAVVGATLLIFGKKVESV